MNEERRTRLRRMRRRLLVALWVATALAIPIWVACDSTGWDAAIYERAIRAVVAGRDPYADAMAVQRAVRAQMGGRVAVDPPYSYVYSPMTLPLLRVAGAVPGWVLGWLYWMVYAAGVVGEMWVGFWLAEEREREVFLFLMPVAAFFPGFLANGIVMSGNIAYVLYAGALGATVWAWRGGSWQWFYAMVIAASCVKAPMLSLLAIPALSGRRQWGWAAGAGFAGLGLFAFQPLRWPVLFYHYLQAVELQFSFNRDFGCSPAGLFSGFLYDRGIPYSPGSLIFYVGYALPLVGVLIHLSRRFERGEFSIREWGPTLLVGVILLNPRLIEYDVAPLALPMALIGWRGLNAVTTRVRSAVALGAVFVCLNVPAVASWEVRKLLDGPLLVGFFAVGCWMLVRERVEVGAWEMNGRVHG